MQTLQFCAVFTPIECSYRGAFADGDSAEDSQKVFEDLTAIGMIQEISLRCMMTTVRDFQDGQDGSILTDATAVNLTSQPLVYGFTACPARGDLTACGGEGVYGLRLGRLLEQPCSEEGRNRMRSAVVADRDSPLFCHMASLARLGQTPCSQPRSAAEADV